ncbi:hypothetical protein PMAYCL1PPCAC_13823, partial [Pristionchus mayeri]
YLLCSCGLRYNSEADQNKHDKKCTGHEFTLHKLDQKVTPQCVQCEVYPSTAYGYGVHLRRHHKTSLLKVSTSFNRSVKEFLRT